jgi:hypothetical protein
MSKIPQFYQPINPENIDKVITFLPQIESLPTDQIQKKRQDPGQGFIDLDVDYQPTIWKLMRAFEDNGFVQSYDWGTWQPEAERIFHNPPLLETADLETCVKLITLHVRKDRFCSGHFGEMVASGHLAAILRRLDVLRKILAQVAGTPKTKGRHKRTPRV